ncbi:MAG: class I SAM-dependent methyltransferase [Solirubrobacterales bacterium]|nr:class I SAM-dependent methyltransferase [Solirubrobacterales bacterium]
MASEVHHPLFARFFTWFSEKMEPELGPYRSELVSGLSGRILEVGSGNGMNFAHYGKGVTEVVALEPEAYMREKAAESATRVAPKIMTVDGNATALPFEDDSFDHVVACMVLCSIDDPATALREARRVLKPNGQLHFFEHVRAGSPAKARVQRLLDDSRIWPWVAGGCHCSRDTVGSIEAAGFQISQVRDETIGVKWGHTNPHVIGCASPHTSA